MSSRKGRISMKGKPTGRRSRRLVRVAITSCAAAVVGGAFLAAQAGAQNVTVKPTPGEPWAKNIMFYQPAGIGCIRLIAATGVTLVSNSVQSGTPSEGQLTRREVWIDTSGKVGWRNLGIKAASTLGKGGAVYFKTYPYECRSVVFGKGPNVGFVKSGVWDVKMDNLHNVWVDPARAQSLNW
jgi:hypothetical protein